MSDSYARVIRAACRTPWALMPERVMTIREILQMRAAGERFTPEELRARINGNPHRPAASSGAAGRGDGQVAVVPIYGVIAHRTFEASSGMTSAEGIGRMFRSALQNENVSAIVFDVASPGGAVTGVPELAAEIFAARDKKPMVAVANGLMASAAYWLAAMAHEIVMIPSGEVGSIGVWSLHEDWTQHLEDEGIKLTSFVAGDRKLEGAPWIPLDEEARAHFQGLVDETYQQFLAAVAKGRGVTVTEVKKSYGAGRTFTAKEAKTRGMVNRVATLDDVIARLSASAKGLRSSAAAALPANSPAPAVLPAAQLACPVTADGRHADPDDEGVCIGCGADLWPGNPLSASGGEIDIAADHREQPSLEQEGSERRAVEDENMRMALELQ